MKKNVKFSETFTVHYEDLIEIDIDRKSLVWYDSRSEEEV
jgi:hypothetical protein